MAGLVRKKITVRGKKGTYQRSVMVRAGEAVKRTAGKVAKFVGKHKGKIAAGVGAAALTAGALALAHKRGHIDLRGVAGNAKELARSAGGALKARAGSAASAAKGAAGRGAFRAAGAVDRATSAVKGAAGRAAFRTAGAIDSLSRSRNAAPTSAPAATLSAPKAKKKRK